MFKIKRERVKFQDAVNSHTETMKVLEEQTKIHLMEQEERAERRKLLPSFRVPSASKVFVVGILLNCLALEIFVCWYLVQYSAYVSDGISALIGLIVPMAGVIGTIVPYFQKATAENLHKYPSGDSLQAPIDEEETEETENSSKNIEVEGGGL